MKLREIYRDDDLLVVDKPFGLASQPTRGDDDDVYTLLSAQERYVGLHHRLDRPASGLLLLTLQEDVNKAIATAFQTHAVDRTYAAVLAGTADALSARWEAPVDGREAVTDVETVGARGGLLAVLLRPQTGRLHQLRRHASQAGVPILGDRRHGGDAGRWWPRLALHAHRMALSHPRTGERLVLESPIPGDLAVVWARAGGP